MCEEFIEKDKTRWQRMEALVCGRCFSSFGLGVRW